MIEQRVSTRYARAILAIANQENIVEDVFRDFIHIKATIESSREFKSMLLSPIIQFWKKKKVLTELFEADITKLSMNFLLLLADKRRENMIPSIAYQFEKLYDKQYNRLPVQMDSAVDLDEDNKAKVLRILEELTHKTILPEFNLDRELKGGLKIKVDDWVYDASLKNQLEKLFKRLSTD